MSLLVKPQSDKGTSRRWWRGAAIYQIYPRSFADSNGDGMGDLPGITARLDYIASLGVEAIWLSPFFTSPMRDFGYDVSDYCDVDPIFGTLGDFDHLVQRAHQLGLRIVIDQVYSHTSDLHPWFQESRSSRTGGRADWYVWADAKPDGSPPSNWQSVFGGPAWTWDARRGQYYLHNFLAEQPALNVRNDTVQQALLDCARFWLDRGVDGFRLDAINYAMHDPALTDNPPAPANGRARTRSCDFQLQLHNKSHPDITKFLERIRAVVDEYGERFMVAEIGGENPEPVMQLYTQGNKLLHSAYGFNFLYADRLTPARVKNALEAWPDTPGTGWPSWAFSNHDAPRAISRWARPEDHEAYVKLSMLLLVCLRGNIFLYQGEELGLPQAEIPFEDLKDPEAIANWPLTLGRDGARTPMPWHTAQANAGFSSAKPWLPIGASHTARAVDGQERLPHSPLAVTRELLALRRRSEALKEGALHVTEASETFLVFERRSAGQQLICLFNFGPAAETWRPPAGERWRVLAQVGGVADGILPPLSGAVAERLA